MHPTFPDLPSVKEATKEQLEYNIDNNIAYLLRNEPFFAEISRHVEKRSLPAIKTAGVRVTSEGHYELVYNPILFSMLSQKHVVGILKHEFYHLVLGHVSDRMPDGKMTKKWNVATDLAINSYLPDEVPDWGLHPAKEGSPYKKYPAFMTAEWYYNNVKENGGQKGEGKGEGDGEGDSMDDHSGWGEGDEIDSSVREIAKERLREHMRNAADAANKSSNGWGSIPQECRQEIIIRANGKINWRAILRYFIKTSQRASKTSTMKRINKRYPYIHAGTKVKRHARIAISIDQSGSVDDDMLAKFFTELNSLAKIAEFTVIPFDTNVSDSQVYVWKKGKYRKIERVRQGGTDFNAPTEYVNGKDFDGHIVLTDMQAPKPISSKCQRMWMTTKECMNSLYFTTTERIIPVE